MHSVTKLGIIIGLFATNLVTAIPQAAPVPDNSASTFVKFFRGQACTGSSSSVDFQISNPGCFADDKYVSMNVKGGSNENGESYWLIASPKAGCNCQKAAQKVTVTGNQNECYEILPEVQAAQSYRWQNDPGTDNCP